MVKLSDRDAKREEKWREHYDHLLRFIKREGHCRVPARHVENGFRLGRWVVKQREDRERMTKSRRESLERIDGWFWKGQEAKWDRARHLLEQFVSRNGHAMVPKKHVEDGFNLGVWVMHVRDQYKRGELPEDRARYLNRTKGWAWYPSQKTQAKRKPRALAQEELTNQSLDELAEIAWGALFGEGPVREYLAVHRLARQFNTEQLTRARHARRDSPLARLLKSVLKKGVENGYFDRPKPRYIRAVLRDPVDYQTEDWQRCLTETLSTKPIELESAIGEAASWASGVYGLDYSEIARNDVIWKGLQKAINNGVRRGEIERMERGVIRAKPRRKRA